MFRDVFFYIISIIELVIVFLDGDISNIEATIMLLSYVVYIIVCVYSRSIEARIKPCLALIGLADAAPPIDLEMSGVESTATEDDAESATDIVAALDEFNWYVYFLNRSLFCVTVSSADFC